MTPAQVWSDAYLTEYRIVREMCWEAGYNDPSLHLANGETVKQLCHRLAEAFAEETRAKWLAANPNWLLEIQPNPNPIWYIGPASAPPYEPAPLDTQIVCRDSTDASGRVPLYTGTTREPR